MSLFKKNSKPEFQCPRCNFLFSGRPERCQNCGLIFTWDTYDQKHSSGKRKTTQIVAKNTELNSQGTYAHSNVSGVRFPDWYVSISFGKSSSDNYMKAVALAKAAPQYHEQYDDGKILHQAIYSANPKEYLSFIMLYELVEKWKSSFVIINGQLIDRKIVGNLNYCYGDRCRSGNPKFCFGASYMTENPFGCHRLQISACNHPWWSFYRRSGMKWVLDTNSMLKQINSYANIYSLCPVFNYRNIINELHQLPQTLSDRQYSQLIKAMEAHTGMHININI